MTMVTTITDFNEARRHLSRRGGFAEPSLPPHVVARNRELFGEDLSPDQIVARTISEVRSDGDDALRRFALAYDGREPAALEVPKAVLEAAWHGLAAEVRDAFALSAERIRAYHLQQPAQSWIAPGEYGLLGQILRPLQRVGVYAPAGTAPLPSSLLMMVIPARVAGVDEIIVCTPGGPDGACHPMVLAAAWIAGVDRVFAIGGAAAVAAMAYGTETIPGVDMVAGPGNLFVSLAKKQVYGDVQIDMMAGPTETLVIADGAANVELTAADLIAQAEHGETSAATLVTTSQELATAVRDELGRQLTELPRGDIVAASLAANGCIIVVETLSQAIDLANAYAPEHLCLLVQDPWSLVPSVRNAGGIFIGEQSPEAIGDYTAGPSHVMPTGGSARYASPVNVRDFQKVISVVGLNDRAVEDLGPATIAFAEAEGLEGHAAAVRRRLAQP
jgi:histidinol dehydrogenase